MGKVQVSYIDDDGKETILRSVEEFGSTDLFFYVQTPRLSKGGFRLVVSPVFVD